jgi:formate hydrogenlyase subunit 4
MALGATINLITALDALVLLASPPLLIGVINRIKAIAAGRTGAPVAQPYHDLAKLFRKGMVQSGTTTWAFRAGPVVGLASVLTASLLMPIAGGQAAVSFAGDVVLLAYLLALARFFTITAALDTGSAFEGMGSAREATFACLTEPAFFLCMLVLARHSGAFSLSEMLGPRLSAEWLRAGASLGLVLVTLFILLLAECSRLPFDDPTTHLELTMVHEVMVLDHSGPALGMILYGAALKFSLFATVIARIAAPVGSGGVVATHVVFGLAMLGVAVAVGIVESVLARLRLARIPRLLVAANLFAALALVLVPG